MADADSVRQRIISSVFTAKLVDETYEAHVKIWESDGTEEGGLKPRYIILSRMCSLSLDLYAYKRVHCRGE